MPKDKSVKADKKFEKLENQVSELTADLQRVHADFVNFKRRSDEEKSGIMEMAKESVIMHILPLIDNIERALHHRPEELKDNDWANGVEQVAKQVESTLAELGVSKIRAVGEQFDPELHEAVGYEDSADTSIDGEEIVAEELQAGYKLGDRVIRHSIVKVRKENNNG